MVENKPRILIFIDYFLPGYKAGGPIKSVANIVKTLGDTCHFTIVTANHDLNTRQTYQSLPYNERIDFGQSKIIYLSKNNVNFSTLRYIITTEDYDFVHLNSLFSLYFTLLPIFLIKRYRKDVKILLAPRGMLSSGALKIKTLKKRLFLGITRKINFFRNIYWHVSSTIEQNEAIKYYGSNIKTIIAPAITLIEEVNLAEKPTKKVGEANVFFLSRIQSIKNLDGAIATLKYFNDLPVKINFDILGPVEDEAYWQQCQKLIAELGANIKVNYLGGVPNYDIKEHLKKYHFLFLPTWNENYGHAIVEAFSNGCPAIISDKTKWLNLEQKRVGWDVEPKNPENFIRPLKLALDMNHAEYLIWAESCLNFVATEIYNHDIIEQNKALFT